MTRVLVTGATGFIGSVLCEALAQAGYTVRAALRAERAAAIGIAETVVVGDINSSSDWTAALAGVDSVIHAAARAHVLHDPAALGPLYAETNERATQSLAIAAARSQVRRFVFLSSIKVNGEQTTDHGFTAFDVPRPQDAYAQSKWQAERHVMKVAADSAMEAVIVRSPLVYGPGVRANFLRLIRLVDRGWPLPLGAVHNKRSLVSVWNLCDLLLHVMRHPSASGRTWMVSDGEDLSTGDLLRRIGRAMGKRVRLVPVPVAVLQLCAALAGRRAEIARLSGSLLVDITQTRVDLEWAPAIKMNEALERTVAWYLSKYRSRGV